MTDEKFAALAPDGRLVVAGFALGGGHYSSLLGGMIVDGINTTHEKAVREALAPWETLCAWGGTPEIIHEFIKGQQDRIHAAQGPEKALETERETRRMVENGKRDLSGVGIDCPIHKKKMVPILTSAHYRCMECFEENEGYPCEYSMLDLQKAITAARAEERERCAGIAATWGPCVAAFSHHHDCETGRDIAAAIRRAT